MSVRGSPILHSAHNVYLPARPLLLVVEGVNDIDFLTQLATAIGPDETGGLDFAELLAAGEITFIPFGGGSPALWINRLAPLACPEFHIYDRETSPETERRIEIVACVNRRTGCEAALTSKRSLENYLHPAAIFAAGGGHIAFGDHECVASLVARSWYERVPQNLPWDQLMRRTRRRLAYRAKRWINTVAVGHMSHDLLAERDPNEEVRGWFTSIAAMLDRDFFV